MLAIRYRVRAHSRRDVERCWHSPRSLGGCSAFKPPLIAYDADVPPLPDPPALTDYRSRPLHVPPSWAPSRGGKKGAAEAKEPVERIETANEAARVEPRKAGYYNAVQLFSYSPGALYQVYASPGQSLTSLLNPAAACRLRSRCRR